MLVFLGIFEGIGGMFYFESAFGLFVLFFVLVWVFLSFTCQINAFALKTVSFLVPEGNIPPHIWVSNQQTSYRRQTHSPMNSPISSPSQLLCFQTLDLAQLICCLFLFFFFFGVCLGTFYSRKREFPAVECGTTENGFCSGCCHCTALFG